MTIAAHAKPVIIWLALIVLTLLSVAFAQGVSSHFVIVVSIFAVAAAKAQLVAIHFMEVRQAQPHWHTLYRVWILIVAAMLIAGYLV